MNLRTPFYCLREALHSLVRNAWMTLACVAIVAVSLTILGGSVLLVLNADTLSQKLESEVEITAFLKPDLNTSQIQKVDQQVKALPDMGSVKFISKEQALKDMKKSFGDRESVLENLPKNPLQDAYRVKAVSAGKVDSVAQKLSGISGVANVRYGKNVVEKLLAITHWVRLISLGLMAVLAVAAVFLIATTIRMSVYARRKEIGIMKILGATNWYVRAPFLLEGAILGSLGAMIAVLIVNFSYLFLLNKLELSLPFITLVAGAAVLPLLLKVVLGLGVLIGVMGSTISIRRFLKV